MRLMRIGPPGRERPAARDEDGTVFDLSGLTGDIDGLFLAGDGLARTRRALDAGLLPVFEADGERVGGRLEVELAVVIGGRARYLGSPAQASEVIAGYVVSHDVSERTFQHVIGRA